ncbi:MAG: hypothetical protein M1305_06465, partial [Candidatus Marsarchaeota archaeon]|nr:hypothetical protein [Candidatus Marsarchaeota archaeon]
MRVLQLIARTIDILCAIRHGMQATDPQALACAWAGLRYTQSWIWTDMLLARDIVGSIESFSNEFVL